MILTTVRVWLCFDFFEWSSGCRIEGIWVCLHEYSIYGKKINKKNIITKWAILLYKQLGLLTISLNYCMQNTHKLVKKWFTQSLKRCWNSKKHPIFEFFIGLHRNDPIFRRKKEQVSLSLLDINDSDIGQQWGRLIWVFRRRRGICEGWQWLIRIWK